MKQLRINLQRDEKTFINDGETVYEVRKPYGQPTGFYNAFNMFVEGKQAARLEQMFEVEARIVAYPDGRFKSGYRFVQD